MKTQLQFFLMKNSFIRPKRQLLFPYINEIYKFHETELSFMLES